jgi:uncharacterized membrane protein HdeD (DUF308 family)
MTTSVTSDDAFTLDAGEMTRTAINGFRAAFAIGGAAALVLGVVMLIWPVKTVAVFAATLGIFFVVSGIIRVALGIFSSGPSASHRLLNIVLGLLLVIAGVVALKNPAASAATLLVFVIIVVGVAWIVDGVMSIVESKSATSPGWAITYGIIGIIAGLSVVAVPAWSVVGLVVFASIALIVLGLVGIVRGATFGNEVASSRPRDARTAGAH